jgi:hypothetical protein
MMADYQKKYEAHRKANPGLYEATGAGGKNISPTNPVPPSDFGSAFSAARQARQAATGVGAGGTFQFGGKSYSTNSANDFGVRGGRIGPAEAPPQFGVPGGRIGPAEMPAAPFGVTGGRIGPAMPPQTSGPQTSMANRMARNAGQPLPNPFAGQQAGGMPQAPQGMQWVRNQRGQLVLVPE